MLCGLSFTSKMIEKLNILDTNYVILAGPKGFIQIFDLVWCPDDRQDLLHIFYWESWGVLNGAYHCCFSIPGKVFLLKPNDPRCNMGQAHD